MTSMNDRLDRELGSRCSRTRKTLEYGEFGTAQPNYIRCLCPLHQILSWSWSFWLPPQSSDMPSDTLGSAGRGTSQDTRSNSID